MLKMTTKNDTGETNYEMALKRRNNPKKMRLGGAKNTEEPDSAVFFFFVKLRSFAQGAVSTPN
jgi:hypothetical protein